MPAGFGFENYAAQRPTPRAQDVGLALVGRRVGPGNPDAMGGMMGSGPMDGVGLGGPSPSGDPMERALREDGARRMSAPGQMDDPPGDDGRHSLNAVNVAVGEALTRMGGGYTTNPNPFKPRDSNARQLMQLGLSEVEARLLVRTGGV